MPRLRCIDSDHAHRLDLTVNGDTKGVAVHYCLNDGGSSETRRRGWGRWDRGWGRRNAGWGWYSRRGRRRGAGLDDDEKDGIARCSEGAGSEVGTGSVHAATTGTSSTAAITAIMRGKPASRRGTWPNRRNVTWSATNRRPHNARTRTDHNETGGSSVLLMRPASVETIPLRISRATILLMCLVHEVPDTRRSRWACLRQYGTGAECSWSSLRRSAGRPHKAEVPKGGWRTPIGHPGRALPQSIVGTTGRGNR